MSPKLEKWLGLAALLMLMPSLIFQTVVIVQPQLVNAWKITEWLVSYRGGFVRRGLAGEFIRFVASGSGIAPSVIIAVLTFAVFIVFSVWLWSVLKDYVPAYLLFSPLLLGMPVYSSFVGKKDVLLALAFLAGMTVLFRPWPAALRLLILNSIAVLCILMHEAFIFIGLPMFLYAYSRLTWGEMRPFKAAIRFLPGLATALAVIVFKGNPQVAEAITQDWNMFFRAQAPEYCCFAQPPAAIQAIGWTTLRGLRMSYNVFTGFRGPIWLPLIWAASLFFTILAISVLMKRDDFVTRFFQLHLFEVQLLCGLPLFLLGSDFGRWIFLIVTTAVIAGALWSAEAPEQRPRQKPLLLPFLYPRSGMALPVGVICCAAVPMCCWNLLPYVLRMPPVSVLHSIYRIMLLGS